MSDMRGQPATPADPSHPTSAGAPSVSGTSIARRRGPWRWAVAGLATALLVVSGSGLVAFAQTGGGTGAGPTYLPADTSVYLELRADMPAGQREALARMMAHFPGFADVAAFDMKVDATLDDILTSGTDSALSWTADVKPWFGGDIGIGIVGDLSAMQDSPEPPLVLGITVSDRAAFDAFMAKARETGSGPLGGEGSTLEESEYKGATVVSGGDDAFAVTDDLFLLATSEELLTSALDTLAGDSPSLAADEGFQTAFARVPDARLGAAWMDLAAMRSLIEAAMSQSQSAMDPAALEQLPLDMTMYAAATEDGATIEAFITPAAATPAMSVGESTLATRFAPETQLYIETRQIGTTVGAFLDLVAAQSGDDSLTQLGAFLGQPGAPMSELFAWAEDAAVGASISSDGAWLGVGIEVLDPQAAARFVDGLLGIVGAIALDPESGVTVTTSDVAGTPVTTIDVAGLDEQMPLPGIDTSISIALTEDAALLGTGPFVADALQQTADASLAASPGYAEATAAVGTPNFGQVYVDITGLRTGLEPMLPLIVGDYESMAPFIEPFDRLAASATTTEDGVIAVRLMLFLR